MNRETTVLLISTLCFAAGVVLAVRSLRETGWRPQLRDMLLAGAGFTGQCLFLAWRGQALQRCPITHPAEILIFVSWAMLMLYFVVGPAYRLSLLGAFTWPVAFAFQSIALLWPGGLPAPVIRVRPDDALWTELHAALSLLSYGCFAVAFAAGVMFLVQDRLLKRHALSPLTRAMPPVHYLTQAIRRLVLIGLILLTAGILCAYRMYEKPGSLKLATVWAVWGSYVLLAGYEFTRGMSARRAALAAVGVFLIPVVSLWIVSPR